MQSESIEQEFIDRFQKNLMSYFGCGCTPEQPERKEDCYFYEEDNDMGARIPFCTYHGGYGECPCKGCDKYISKANARKIIMEHIKNEVK